MPVKRTIQRRNGAPVHIWTDDVDHKAIEQLAQTAALPIIAGHIAAMPDVHVGVGATVGSVIPTGGALIPAAVGVDIGCGMAAVRLTLNAAQLPDTLRPARDAVENAVPVGFAMHDAPAAGNRDLAAVMEGLGDIIERHPAVAKMGRNVPDKAARQLGTLGGGNHFIELCLDEADRCWIMLHSGSRGVGNAIGRYFTGLAKRDMEARVGRLPTNRDLAYLEEGTIHFGDYRRAVLWAQDYALRNRRLMLKRTLEALAGTLPPFTAAEAVVECHHNYVAAEHHFGREVYVTRKGAIRAEAGDLGIIPGSMGTRSYIVRGRGCAEALNSCAHGAGRRMSRRSAKERFDADDLAAQTAGVECRKDAGVLDEIPAAYKPIDEVMAHSSDLVEVVHTLKQVLCVKG